MTGRSPWRGWTDPSCAPWRCHTLTLWPAAFAGLTLNGRGEAHEVVSAAVSQAALEGRPGSRSCVLGLSGPVCVLAEHNPVFSGCSSRPSAPSRIGDRFRQLTADHRSRSERQCHPHNARRDNPETPEPSCIERVKHEHVGLQRWDRQPLGCSFRALSGSRRHLHRGYQPALDLAQNPTLLSMVGDRLE